VRSIRQAAIALSTALALPWSAASAATHNDAEDELRHELARLVQMLPEQARSVRQRSPTTYAWLEKALPVARAAASARFGLSSDTSAPAMAQILAAAMAQLLDESPPAVELIRSRTTGRPIGVRIKQDGVNLGVRKTGGVSVELIPPTSGRQRGDQLAGAGQLTMRTEPQNCPPTEIRLGLRRPPAGRSLRASATRPRAWLQMKVAPGSCKLPE
jgi:hypothetical protein